MAGTIAHCIADLIDVNVKTVAYCFHRLRETIAEEESCEGMDLSEFEDEESDFGGKRKGKKDMGP